MNRPTNILSHLRELFPGARTTTLRRMVADGRVNINGERVRSVNRAITAGDRITVLPTPSGRRARGRHIIYSDAHICIYNKPVGLITSTTRDERRPTAIRELEKYIDRTEPAGQIYLVHRLDRDASGLLIFARDVQSLADLKIQFRRHTITRRYRVWVHGSPPPTGELTDNLTEGADGRVERRPSGKPARLHYRVLASRGTSSLLEVDLYTGRKHQIRVQLAARGWPVLGDRVYGKPDGQKRLLLHATDLIIDHPAGRQRMAFRSPLPNDFHPKPPRPPGRGVSA